MPRSCRLLYPEAQSAAAQVAAMVGTARPKRQKRVRVEQVTRELEEAIRTKATNGLRPVHLVALWARCHERVYGAAPAELTPDAWLYAASAAGKLVRDEFRGDVSAAVEFLRWTWSREKYREERAKREAVDRVSRIGWRLQFAQRYLLTDYRVSLARRGAR